MEAGQRLKHYEIERSLGTGGFGGVFLAKDLKLNKKVAIKALFQREGKTDPQVLHRFQQEIQTILMIHHPNVIQIFDFELEGPEPPYYVMEYLKGEDLEGVIQSQREPLSLVQIFLICQQLCGALHAVHERGIVFRDLKTENIFMVDSATYQFVKLIDFGLALEPEARRITSDGVVVGTPMYMSPEQIMKPKELTIQSDMYSFGVLLFRLLTGKFPYCGDDPREILRQVCMGDADLSVADLRPGMRDFLQQLLARKPSTRPESILLVWQALSELLVEMMREQSMEHLNAVMLESAPALIPKLSANQVMDLTSTGDHATWETNQLSTRGIFGDVGEDDESERSNTLEFTKPVWK